MAGLSGSGRAVGQDAALDVDGGGAWDAALEAPDGGVAEAGPPEAALDPPASTSPGEASTASRVEEEPPSPPARGARLVLRSVLGLVLLVVLVWAASHPRLRRIEEWLGLRQVLTAGFAFVALGVVARQPAVGILSDDVLDDLTPVLHFALGWLGLVIGFQLDVRMLRRLPKGTALTVATESLAPFTAVTAGGALLMVACGEPWRDPLFLRHAIALGAAGAVSVTAARERPGPWRADEPRALVAARVDSLDEIVGVIALAVVGAFFRPVWVHWRWELPGTVWLFVTLGMGASVGLLVYAMIRERASSSEFLAIIVGGVALGAGMAGYVFLSPIVICFCIGAALANLPLEGRARLASVITVLERPVYYVLLTIGGALWDVDEPLGWALVLVFLASRLIGFLAARTWLDRASARGAPVVETTRALLRPISPISIAIVVSLQLMYRGRPISWIVTAVIGAAILTEALLQIRGRWIERRAAR